MRTNVGLTDKGAGVYEGKGTLDSGGTWQATGAGWVYEYALVDRSYQHNLAELRSIQDWQLRYQLETVPGASEVPSIGACVRSGDAL